VAKVEPAIKIESLKMIVIAGQAIDSQLNKLDQAETPGAVPKQIDVNMRPAGEM